MSDNTSKNFNSVVKIANISLPGNKATYIALSYIRGIGIPTSKQICKSLKLDIFGKIGSLSNEQIEIIRGHLSAMIENKEIMIEEELTKFVVQNIKNVRKIGAYRGLRHARGLPVRGQNTKKNARTRKGKRSNASSGGKK